MLLKYTQKKTSVKITIKTVEEAHCIRKNISNTCYKQKNFLHAKS